MFSKYLPGNARFVLAKPTRWA